MPNRNPIETGPYHIAQRIRAHPGVSVMAVWSLLAGLAMAADSQLPGPTVSLTLATMPDGFRLWTSLTLFLGGVLATIGLLGNWNRLDRSWRVEKLGCWLLLGAWMTMAIVAYRYTPLGVVSWGNFAAYAVMAFFRQWAICHIQDRMEERG